MSENDSNYDFYQLPNSLSSFKEKSKTESNYSKIKKTLFIILLGNFLTILYTINHNLLKKIKYSFNCPILFYREFIHIYINNLFINKNKR